MCNVKKAISVYLRHLAENQASAAHLKTVTWRLNRFAAGREKRSVTKLTRMEVAEFVVAYAEGRADGTVAGMVTTLRAWFTWLKKRKLTSKNLGKNLKRPRFDPVVRTAAPSNHIHAVTRCLPAFVAHRDQRPRDVRDALLVSLSLDCGGRLGSMADLRRSEVEKALKSGGSLAADGRRVYRVISRGKTGSIALEFCEETADLFRLWFTLSPPTTADRVFVSLSVNHLPQGTPLRRETATKAFARVCEFAGVPTFRAHAIRKRNISDIIATNDAEVAQRYAGHRDLSTTMLHYREKSADQVRNATAQLASSRRSDIDFDEEMGKLFRVK